MAATHQARVKGDNVKQRAEAQLLLDQAADGPALGPDQSRIEEELARVVARLAVDVDRPGEVGGKAVVEPVGIGEPGVGLRQDHELTGAGVVEAQLTSLFPGQHAVNARLLEEQFADRLESSARGDVNVGQLVIAHGAAPCW